MRNSQLGKYALLAVLLFGSHLIQPISVTAHPVTKSGPLGLGIMFGEPTGLNLKYWTGSINALNFGLTYSFGNYVVLLGDYLWHFPKAFPNRTKHQFVPYLGVGGAVSLQSSSRYNSNAVLGVRIPLGIEFLPNHPTIGVFLELAPGITIVPSVSGFLQGDIGIRYYF